MAALYLVDTSVWIFAVRRNPQPAIRNRVAALLEMDQIAICGLVELELLGGAANAGEFSRLKARLHGLHRFSIGDLEWEAAAESAFALRRLGVTVPFTDVLLAAVALRHNAILLHADRDFDLIAKHTALDVESLADLVTPAEP